MCQQETRCRLRSQSALSSCPAFQFYIFGISSLRVHDPWRSILFSLQLCRAPFQRFSGNQSATNQPISKAPSGDLPMEAATELATAHSITLRLAPPFLASLALSTCSASVGRFHLRRFRVFRCLMFLLHDVRTSARAFSEMPAGHWIRDIIIYTPTNQL